MAEMPKGKSLESLPIWAQVYIEKLKRERHIAVDELDRWTDEQTPSQCQIIELVPDGKRAGPSIRKRYVQTDHLEVVSNEICLGIHFPPNRSYIRLHYSLTEGLEGDVNLIPTGYQQFNLNTTKKKQDDV